jgi:predicted regulator of Ras-like GTPase activity (Roadblock/LC7/MglB family)
VDDQGVPLVWELRGGVEPMLVATAGAVLARATARAADHLDMGTPRNVVLTTDQGSVAVFRIADNASLVTLLQPTANNILVLVEVGKTLERLRGVMAPGG